VKTLHWSRARTDRPERRKSVVFITSDYAPGTGGIASQTRLHALELLRNGWTVDVLTRRRSSDVARLETLDGVTVRRLGKSGFSRSGRAREIVAAWYLLVRQYRRVAVVQIVMDADYVVAPFFAGLGRRTCLMWAAEGDAELKLNRLLGRIRRIMLRPCSQVVLTAQMQRELASVAHVESAPIIPVPVDTTYFTPANEELHNTRKRELGISAEYVIVFTGHLIESKGVDKLLDAFSMMVQDGVDAHLLLVGGDYGRPDSLVDRLRSTTNERLLTGRVTFVGPVRDVRPYLQAADTFCLPSLREGMSNSILEAMASGLPCVAPVSAAGLELLADGAGIVPDSNSAEDLFAALMTLARSEETRHALSNVALERATSRHNVADIILAYEAVWAADHA
jgi:glycosyltransferase involved in cell wall biosynthesis